MREELYRASCQDTEDLSVFIDAAGQHTGIIHRGASGLQVLDFTSSRVRARPLPGDKITPCVTPNIDADEVMLVRGMCRLIASNPERHKIPFSFKWATDSLFSPKNGEFLPGSGRGLSCASFVLAVFLSARVPLVDVDGWEVRDDDQQRVQELRPDLEIALTGPEVKAFLDEWPCTRIRPEEAVGAGMADDLPADFSFARFAGEWVMAMMYGEDPPSLN